MPMNDFERTYNRYPGFYTDWVKNGEEWTTIQKPMTQDMMLPDIVLDVLKETTAVAVKPVFEQHLKSADVLPPLNRHRLLIPEPRLSWADTCALVVKAFRRFDENLGDKVAAILSDRSRFKVEKVEVGEASGYCTAPGWQGRDRAEINYSYDGTINDAVYLAHELGHLLAHDFAQESGYQKEGTWMPMHILEVPAMFTQCILYDYLMNGQENKTLQKIARQHFTGEMTRQLYEQQVAFALDTTRPFSQDEYEAHMRTSLGEKWAEFSRAKDKQSVMGKLHRHISVATIGVGFYFSGLGKNPAVFDSMFKQGKDSDILRVFETAGIQSKQQLTNFLSQAIENSKRPLVELSAGNKPKRPVKKALKFGPQ